MRTPDFWNKKGILSHALLPFSWLYAAAQTAHRVASPFYPAPLPTLCVGNVTAGGAGKTPTVQAVVALLKAEGRTPHILCRGYGGTHSGPLRVDPETHSAADTGDEALLHAALAPSWIARDRMAGLLAAKEAGADCVVMDDGLQHYAVHPTASLLVIDGRYGFGNRRLLPAGPLREPVMEALKRVHGVIMIGEDERRVTHRFPSQLPIFTATLEPEAAVASTLAGVSVLAFAGIGHPEKFRRSLQQCGAVCEVFHSFPDHHAYTPAEIEPLLEEADRQGWRVVTTAKDAVKLPLLLRQRMVILPVTMRFTDPLAVSAFLTHRMI